MITTIEFERVGDNWEATWTSGGDAVMQIERKSAEGIVSVSANMQGMQPVVVATLSNPYGNGIIASLKIAAGLKVTVRSATEITSGKLMTT